MQDTHPPQALRGSSVIEFRQYEMQPGRRDELIDLFEREFIQAQEDVGLRVLGIFCDADAPDRFIWLRGFADMSTRLDGLQAFYGGPVWQQHRAAANATMVDSDNVLLLQPLSGALACAVPGALPGALAGALPGACATGAAGIWHALICPLKAPWSAGDSTALVADAAWFTTHVQVNNFPRLPVRSGTWLLALSPLPVALPDAVRALLAGAATRLRLLPTQRAPLR